jgi:hypothetical protein
MENGIVWLILHEWCIAFPAAKASCHSIGCSYCLVETIELLRPCTLMQVANKL